MSDTLSNLTVDKLINITQDQLNTSHSPLGVFSLPAGVLLPDGQLLREITVREMTGNEEDILASQKIPPTKKVNELLSRCLTRLGHITDREFINKAVKDMLSGDRAYLLMAIRRVTLGDSYSFADKCPEEGCGIESLYTIDLSQLEATNPEAPLARFHEVSLPSGKKASWHYLNGNDEERQQSVKYKDDVMSLGIWVRLDLLEGKQPTIQDVKNLSQKDRQFLRTVFQNIEPNLDLTLQMTCEACGHEFERELDLSPGFFYPEQVKKPSKKRSST